MHNFRKVKVKMKIQLESRKKLIYEIEMTETCPMTTFIMCNIVLIKLLMMSFTITSTSSKNNSNRLGEKLTTKKFSVKKCGKNKIAASSPLRLRQMTTTSAIFRCINSRLYQYIYCFDKNKFSFSRCLKG